MSSRNSYLIRKYGIDEKTYLGILKDQDGCCFICQRHHTKFITRLCVDHNHRTGEIRGLLCTFCNRRVIGRHVDPVLFERAGKYLRRGTGLFVPEKKKKRKRNRKVRNRRHKSTDQR